MTSRPLNEAELFFTETLRHLNLNSSACRSYSNLKKETRHGHSNKQAPIKRIHILPSGELPLIELWVELFLLHCRLLFGGLVLVWQQQEGDVAVYAVFTLRHQTPVQRKHIYSCTC